MFPGLTTGKLHCQVPFFLLLLFYVLKENSRVILSLLLGFRLVWAYCSMSYQAIVVSLGAHLLMFYLYKFYTVGQIFPSYSLFPIFGIGLTFLIFGEIPTILFLIGAIIVLGSVYLLHKIR